MNHPKLLEPEPLLSALATVLSLESPCILVICTSKVEFYDKILDSSINENQIATLGSTLENIERSMRIKVYFCESLPILYARLATLDCHSKHLVLFYPLALHSDLSAHSAQALNHTVALAVDTAYKLEARLLLFEPTSSRTMIKDENENDKMIIESDHESRVLDNPWDQHLPILSATASRFGTERGWVGRTISARQVVNRWCPQ